MTTQKEAQFTGDEKLWYQALIQSMNDGFGVIDENNVFTYVNSKFAQMLGYSEDEMIGKVLTSFVNEENKKILEENIRKRTFGSSSQYELEWTSKSGKQIPTIVSGTPMIDDKNKHRGSFAVITDITEWKKSEELFRRTFEAIPSPAYIWEKDEEGRIVLVMVNRTIIRYSKGTINDYIGKGIEELFPNDPAIVEMVCDTFKTGEPVYMEFYYETHPTCPRWIVCNVNKPAENAVLMIMTDITEIKNAAEVLRERVSRLELISRTSQRTTSILELDDVIHQAVNLIRDEFDYYAVSLFLANTHEIVLRAAANPNIKHREGEFRLKIGAEGIVGWVHARGKPLLVQDVSKDARYYEAPELPDTKAELAVPIKLKGTVIGVLDVQSTEIGAFSEQDIFTLQTIADQLAIVIENARLYEAAQNEILERKRAENALRKTSDISDLYLDLMSHDITNQLQVILGAISLLQNTCTDPSLLGLVTQIHTSAKKCAKVISKVKATDGLLTAPMEPKSIDITLRECVYRIYSTDRDIKLETNIAISDAIILADKFLEHMLINLLENAIEHNPYPDRLLRVALVDKENGYELTISDNGPGIPDKQKDWLFDVNRRFGGVGLHQVKQIIEKYGGKIEVLDRIQGDPRQGAQFRIWLPKAES